MTGSAKQSIAPAVIASEAKQSIAPRKEKMDCFAALAMTWNCRRDFVLATRSARGAAGRLLEKARFRLRCLSYR